MSQVYKFSNDRYDNVLGGYKNLFAIDFLLGQQVEFFT